MDDLNPIFAHQAQAVESFSTYFDEIIVVTGKKGTYKKISNVQVIDTQWVTGQPFRNISKFYIKVLPVLFKRNIQIFSHMTEVQSALISPITKLLHIRHYLWYAHTSESFFLKWCHFWASGIITSTSGSCPINSSKVFPVGQGVDVSKFFPIHPLPDLKEISFLHFGRFDPSKNIGEILETCDALREDGREIHFTQIGTPSTELYEKEASHLRAKYKAYDWVTFLPSISRKDIRNEMKKYSAFIHAYRGSLDKTLIESTLLAIPVVTVNPEYIKIFGSWSGKLNPTLLEECKFFLNCDIVQISRIGKKRREIAERNHSLDNWTSSITNFFK